MKPVPIGLSALGMDVLSQERDLPEGAVRNIVNLDVTDLGRLVARPGSRRLSTQSGAHSLFGTADQSFGLYVDGDSIRRLWYQADNDLRTQILLDGLTAGARMRYFEDATGDCDVNVVTIARNGQTIGGEVANFSFNVAWGACRFTFSGETWLYRRV